MWRLAEIWAPDLLPHPDMLPIILGAACAVILLVRICRYLPGLGGSRPRFNPARPPRNGHLFEHWVAENLRRHGWRASVTRASGDQGLDIIARRGGLTLGIQCKRYSGAVGNRAVQEAYAGQAHYRVMAAAVLTTGHYTKSARDLSRSTGVHLLSVKDIPSMHKTIRKRTVRAA